MCPPPDSFRISYADFPNPRGHGENGEAAVMRRPLVCAVEQKRNGDRTRNHPPRGGKYLSPDFQKDRTSVMYFSTFSLIVLENDTLYYKHSVKIENTTGELQ